MGVTKESSGLQEDGKNTHQSFGMDGPMTSLEIEEADVVHTKTPPSQSQPQPQTSSDR